MTKLISLLAVCTLLTTCFAGCSSNTSAPSIPDALSSTVADVESSSSVAELETTKITKTETSTSKIDTVAETEALTTSSNSEPQPTPITSAKDFSDWIVKQTQDPSSWYYIDPVFGGVAACRPVNYFDKSPQSDVNQERVYEPMSPIKTTDPNFKDALATSRSSGFSSKLYYNCLSKMFWGYNDASIGQNPVDYTKYGNIYQLATGQYYMMVNGLPTIVNKNPDGSYALTNPEEHTYKLNSKNADPKARWFYSTDFKCVVISTDGSPVKESNADMPAPIPGTRYMFDAFGNDITVPNKYIDETGLEFNQPSYLALPLKTILDQFNYEYKIYDNYVVIKTYCAGIKEMPACIYIPIAEQGTWFYTFNSYNACGGMLSPEAIEEYKKECTFVEAIYKDQATGELIISSNTLAEFLGLDSDAGAYMISPDLRCVGYAGQSVYCYPYNAIKPGV